jgi:hypothetical protein
VDSARPVFTWYVNRPTPTIVGYNVVTTSVGASPEIKSLVPDLKIQIDKRDIPIFYLNAVEFFVQSGPGQDSVEVAVMLPEGTKILGSAAHAPTPLHSMSCLPIAGCSNFDCKFGPLNPSSSNRQLPGFSQPFVSPLVRLTFARSTRRLLIFRAS